MSREEETPVSFRGRIRMRCRSDLRRAHSEVPAAARVGSWACREAGGGCGTMQALNASRKKDDPPVAVREQQDSEWSWVAIHSMLQLEAEKAQTIRSRFRHVKTEQGRACPGWALLLGSLILRPVVGAR